MHLWMLLRNFGAERVIISTSACAERNPSLESMSDDLYIHKYLGMDFQQHDVNNGERQHPDIGPRI